MTVRIGEVAFHLIQAKVLIEHKNYDEAKKLIEKVKIASKDMKGFDEKLLSKVLQKLEELIKNDSIGI